MLRYGMDCREGLRPYATLFPEQPRPMLENLPLPVVETALTKLRNALLQTCLEGMQKNAEVRNQIPISESFRA
jgi:hypothetical protein